MTIADVSAYNISLTIHIAAVIVGFGATFAQSITFPVAMKVGVQHLPYVHRLHVAINSWLTTPALVVIIATGFYQVAEGDWDMGDFWISGTLAITVILGGMIGAYFIPTDRRLGEMADRELAAAAGSGEAELSGEYQRGARNSGIVGALAGVLVIAAVFLMITKPGL